jgi:hypothetical protein
MEGRLQRRGPLRGEWGPHPDTGVKFRLSIEGWGIGIKRVSHFFDIEGHRLKLSDEEKAALLASPKVTP